MSSVNKPPAYQQELHDYHEMFREFMKEHIVRANKLFEDAEKIRLEHSEELADLRCKLMAREDASGELAYVKSELRSATLFRELQTDEIVGLKMDRARLRGRVEQLESGFRGWLRRLWAKGGA